jgi:hypothetical protein
LDLLPDRILVARFPFLADAPVIAHASKHRIEDSQVPHPARSDSALSLQSAWRILVSRRRLVLSVILGSLALCLLSCLLAPPQYESHARPGLADDAGDYAPN